MIDRKLVALMNQNQICKLGECKNRNVVDMTRDVVAKLLTLYL